MVKYQKGALVSQILKDDGTLASQGVTSSEFTEMNHRSSDAVLVKLEASLLFKSGGTSNTFEGCHFGLVVKPISLGSPALADFEDERFMIGKTHKLCGSTVDTTNNWGWIDALHLDINLKIVVPLDYRIFMGVQNEIGITNAFRYLVRLFWTLI